jgi:uncharacterized lipoprotein YmbA
MTRWSPLVSALLLAGCGSAQAPEASPDQVEAAVRAAELDLAEVEQSRKGAPLAEEPTRAPKPRPD